MAAASPNAHIVLITVPTKDNDDLAKLYARLVETHGASAGNTKYCAWMTAMITTKGALEVRADPDIVDAVQYIIDHQAGEFVDHGLVLLTKGTADHRLVMRGVAFIDDSISPAPFSIPGQPSPLNYVTPFVYFHDDDEIVDTPIQSGPPRYTAPHFHFHEVDGDEAGSAGSDSGAPEDGYAARSASFDRMAGSTAAASEDTPATRECCPIPRLSIPSPSGSPTDHYMGAKVRHTTFADKPDTPGTLEPLPVHKGGIIMFNTPGTQTKYFERLHLIADNDAKAVPTHKGWPGPRPVYNRWLDAITRHAHNELTWRTDAIVVNAVRTLNKMNEDQESPLAILDGDTPGYRLLMEGKAHTNDAMTPCTLPQHSGAHCTEVNGWVHVRDITALLTSQMNAE